MTVLEQKQEKRIVSTWFKRYYEESIDDEHGKSRDDLPLDGMAIRIKHGVYYYYFYAFVDHERFINYEVINSLCNPMKYQGGSGRLNFAQSQCFIELILHGMKQVKRQFSHESICRKDDDYVCSVISKKGNSEYRFQFDLYNALLLAIYLLVAIRLCDSVPYNLYEHLADERFIKLKAICKEDK